MSESWDGGKWLGVCVGLAGDLGRDFGGWPCPRRVCLGRECSPALTGGDVGGQSLAAHPAPSGARDAVLPSIFFFPPHLGFHGCQMNTAIRVSWRRGGALLE